MSFILDALKKSETERQQQGSAEFSQVPVSQGSASPPLWLWVLGILLAINLVVLAGVLLRPVPERLPAADTANAADAANAANAANAADEGFTEQLETAMQESQPGDQPTTSPSATPAVRPTATAASGTDPVTPQTRDATTQAAQAPSPALAVDTTRGLPDIDQLRASGDLQVGELRLDIHVYSDVPADRFVFINMVKHREGSTTSDGLSVDTITPDGVVLSYRGRRFLLPRQ